MPKKNLVPVIIAVLIFTAIGFYGGTLYQKSQHQIFDGAFGQRQINRNGNMGNFRPVNGQIISLDNNTITLKIADGSSRIVVYSPSTKVNKTSEGSVADLKTGSQVTVVGTSSSDGTVTAQTINIGGLIFQGQPANTNQVPNR